MAAILGALMDQAVVDHVPALDLPGRTGWVTDPATVTDPVTGEPRTQMAFFEDLAPFAGGDLVPVAPDEVAAGGLGGLDALVVATDVLDEGAVAAVRAFAEDGGQVLLTDAALRDLPGLVDGVDEVQLVGDDVHPVDLRPGRGTPLTAGVRDISFMTVEPATLGYSTTGGSDTPAYTVDRATWEAAGGTTVALIGGQTAVGQVAVGEGQVSVLGHLLPPPFDGNRVDYGIEEYGVLDTGYLLLANLLGAEVRSQAVDVVGATPVAGPDLPAAAGRYVRARG